MTEREKRAHEKKIGKKDYDPHNDKDAKAKARKASGKSTSFSQKWFS